MPRQAEASARSLALDVLNTVFADRPQPAEATFLNHKDLGTLQSRDRAFARLLYTTTLRRLTEIDAAIAPFLRHPPSNLALRNILRLGVTQLRYLQTPPHAAINQSVELAKRRAPKGAALTNAVLRKVAWAEQTATDLSNLPEWLAKSWVPAFGTDAVGTIKENHLGEPPLDLTVKSDVRAWSEKMGGKPLTANTIRLHRAGPIEAIAGFEEGEWWVQDVAATLPATMFGDVAGKSILDLCAAPGGKTAQLCAAGAKVTAVERSSSRARLLRKNMKRLRFSPKLVEADAVAWRTDRRFDGVLLDAPCTATGTIRRHPDILWTKQPADVERLAKTQSALLDAAAGYVAMGGTLIYAVCSLQVEEGSDQIDGFLQRHPDWRRFPIEESETLGLAITPTPAGDLRTLPSMLADQGGMDGFFIARLQRH